MLPDDLNHWPTDPYLLLGVPRTATAAEARKAYIGLIRHFKPEQYPEHFRRIREAYDRVSAMARFRPASPPDMEPLEQNAAPETERSEPVPPWSRPSTDDEYDRLWEQACRGDLEGAYRAFRSLAEQPEAKVEACVRLYWLLRVAPELDADRPANDWLVQGLRSGGWHGTCHELYRRELEHNSSEALTARFATLLTEAPAATLAPWLRYRWHAAARTRQWGTITADLDALRPRFAGRLDDEIWGQMLVAAVDELAWCESEEAEDRCRDCVQELERRTHLNSRIDLYRLDILLELRRSGRAPRVVYAVLRALYDLIPLSWTAGPGELRKPLLQAFVELLEAPDYGLHVLDTFREQAPLAFMQFVNLVDRCCWQCYTGEGYFVPSNLDEAARRFLAANVESLSEPPRRAFLNFCLDQGVLPDQALASITDSPMAAVAQALRFDDAIRVLCLGYRWLWLEPVPA